MDFISANLNLNSVPFPFSLSTVIEPPCLSAIWCAMARPRPEPFAF